MFSKKKKMEKDAKKLQLIEDTHNLWDKLKNVLNDLYCIKQSLNPLMNTNEEIILQEMPPIVYTLECLIDEQSHISAQG